MLESKFGKKLLQTNLCEVGIFDEKDLNVLNDYNIFTIDQLLGATKGLSKQEIFEEFDNYKEKMELLIRYLKNNLLQSFLDEYKIIKNHPKGLFIRGKNHETK